ncbi:L-glyceraldehyde 3-phosphate reductase [Carnimonas bestiolae]|uniref:L-glyceraldehyde 3-phosphate reductase n=1 Tax=Carnimonas bestiolae TaxID=3402172 RepID=UPI003EDB99E0
MSFNPERYDHMKYGRMGKSSLKLPKLSLGLWHNFGGDTPFEVSRAILHKAFDLGITHFDLANNYGPEPGHAEALVGSLLKREFRTHRDELLISSKAGYDMWQGPYGFGSSKKHIIASCDQSLQRLGVDYVDIFYSHRHDGETPIEETADALAKLVRDGKALYIGISSYNSKRTAEMVSELEKRGVPLSIHQPSYSMLNRWIESDGLLDELEKVGAGCIVFSPLAQGLLTPKYLDGKTKPTRGSFSEKFLTEENLDNIRSLNEIAKRRDQSLPQLALAWALRDERVTSALVGASSPEQLESSVKALDNLEFSKDELAEIDRYAKDGGINLWAASSNR